MKESDLLNITLKIYEQEPLRLNISREKEEIYRKATESINVAIDEYRKKFQVTPRDKILSMVTLNFAIKSLTTSNNKDMDPLLEELKNLDEELKAYLDETTSK